MVQERPQTTATARVETFSDGVFAIALTLLVLELQPPEPGRFASELLSDWPTYLAYLIAFFTIGSIWLSHHNTFSRVRRADPGLLVINLVLLLGAALVPWPTSLMSTALNDGRHDDQVAAIAVYSLITLIMGVAFTLLFGHLGRHPELLRSPEEAAWMRRSGRQSAGTIAAAVVGAGLAVLSPVAALLLYLLVPAAFLVVSLRAREVAAD